MASEYQSIHFNVTEKKDQELQAMGTRPLALRGAPPIAGTGGGGEFHSDEAAARFYLNNILEQDKRPMLRGLTAPERPEIVPDLRLQDSHLSPLTGTRVVRFEQTKSSIPIFGTRAVVEMDRNRDLMAIDAELANVKDISPLAAISPLEALNRIATKANLSPKVLHDLSIQPPELSFYHDRENYLWHLAYFFRNVPAAPPEFMKSAKSHGIGRSLSQRHPVLNYLVDAHTGDILLYYSATPTQVAIPQLCIGIDEENRSCQFFGRVNANVLEMSDPWRKITTFDFGMNDVNNMSPLPPMMVRSQTNDFSDANKAAVSAHINATRVYDFYKQVLMRNSIDDKGMEIISYVNCTSPADENPPNWHNAAWWKQRMWYGQVGDGRGTLLSFSRYLDVIGHELTHGVTEATADLVYLNESGALNESYSDIFGILIKNWDLNNPNGGTVSTWNWEIGSGLGVNGNPLRDFSNPTRTTDPDHMNQYQKTDGDSGGVHTNSNIHNKAAYNVLTAVDAQGRLIFTPRDVAVLYYLCLARLNKLATFSQTLQTLVNIANSYYAGDQERKKRSDAITGAYAKVGIAGGGWIVVWIAMFH